MEMPAVILFSIVWWLKRRLPTAVIYTAVGSSTCASQRLAGNIQDSDCNHAAVASELEQKEKAQGRWQHFEKGSTCHMTALFKKFVLFYSDNEFYNQFYLGSEPKLIDLLKWGCECHFLSTLNGHY